MRRIILPLIAVAALSACKKEAPAPEPTEATVEAAAAPAALPTVPSNARTSVQYAGSYSQTGSDGKTSTLKLNADDTYELTGSDGKTVKGGYNWYKDGVRILLDDAGGKAIYAVADGAVYKLADKDAPVTGLTAEQMWTRAAQ